MTEKDNNCARYTELFFDYIERREENATEEFDELVHHLETCESCRRELIECEKMIAAVSEAEAEPPAELRVGVMTRVKAEAKAYRRQRLLRRVSGIAAAFAICAGILAAYNALGFGAKFDPSSSDGINDAVVDKVEAEGAAPDYSGEGFDDFLEDIFGNADGDEDKNENVGIDEDGAYPEHDEAETGDEETDVKRVFDYADTVTDEARAAFDEAASDGGYGGGVLVFVYGEDAKDALAAVTEYLEAESENGAVILSYELLSKAEAMFYKLSAKYKDVYFVGYKLDGDEKCIVITTR